MKGDTFSILVSAGEPSGDLIGAQVAAAFRTLAPEAKLFGMGGERMAAAGCGLVRPMPSVMGLGSPVRGLGGVAASLARVAHAAIARKARAAVLVDFPDFHLALARILKMAGIPVFQFVSPQLWAWRPGRIAAMRRDFTRTFLIFPFEQKIYDEAGAPALFVGHPAADRLAGLPSKAAARKALGIPPKDKVVALLPGSRRAVLERHLPVFGRTADELANRFPAARFVCSMVPGFDDRFYNSKLKTRPPSPNGGKNSKLVLSSAEGPLILRAADAAVVSSGTGALEALLAGTPMCGVYVTSPFTYNVVKRMAGVDRILMANILSGRDVVREFVQYEAKPAVIASEVEELLTDRGRRDAMRAVFRELARTLGPFDAAGRVAREVVDFCRARQ